MLASVVSMQAHRIWNMFMEKKRLFCWTDILSSSSRDGLFPWVCFFRFDFFSHLGVFKKEKKERKQVYVLCSQKLPIDQLKLQNSCFFLWPILPCKEFKQDFPSQQLGITRHVSCDYVIISASNFSDQSAVLLQLCFFFIVDVYKRLCTNV